MVRLTALPCLLLIVCTIVLVLASSITVGQGLGPEMYGLVGRFGMATPVSTRVLGMGGLLSCVNDVQFANPAFAAVQEKASAGVRYTTTNLDGGPQVDSWLAHYTLPLHTNRDGLQLSFMSLETPETAALLPGMGPGAVDMSETALVVDYGRRISGKLTGGLSVLGFESVDMTVTAGPGLVVADVHDKAEWGFRGGLAYEWAPGDFVGVVYSFSRDSVDCSSQFPQPIALDDLSLDNSQLAIGVSRHLAPHVLLAGEYQHGVTSRTGSRGVADTWNFGMDYLLAPGWSLRLGSNNFDFCWGLGYAGPHWRLDYACINGWNSSDIGQLLGGSSTHSVEAVYCF